MTAGNAAMATYLQSGGDAEAAAGREEGGKKPLGRSISLLSGAVENKGNFQAREGTGKGCVSTLPV
jgi:hypothetical protein